MMAQAPIPTHQIIIFKIDTANYVDATTLEKGE